MMAHRRLHRLVFSVAGLYNLAWGAYAAFDPQWLFRYAGMPLQNHPEVFVCLGMVVGLYGLVYLEVARVPERSWPFVAVGLLGKLLGPLGLTVLIWRGHWPLATAVLCLTNDVLWWVPFSLYLYEAWPAFRRSVWSSQPLEPH